MNKEDIINLAYRLPKTELHLHIEGTFEPALMFSIAKRNNIKLKYSSEKELSEAYSFNNLQEFLDLYYTGAEVLLFEKDFYDLTYEYLKRCKEDNIVHTEIFFDPQTHTQRGVPIDFVVNGINKACIDAKKEWGITYRLIPNFLRHLSEDDGFKCFQMLRPYYNLFSAFGLDSSEVGHPPKKFKNLFKQVREEGFLTVAHAGEEGSFKNIMDAIDLLGTSRVDHGVRAIDDDSLLENLAKNKTPLTVCPLSNLALKVVDELKKLPIKSFIDKGIMITINSDDPAYFGGYLNTNYEAIIHAFDLNRDDVITLIKNSFKASFLDDKEKERWLLAIDSLSKE